MHVVKDYFPTTGKIEPDPDTAGGYVVELMGPAGPDKATVAALEAAGWEINFTVDAEDRGWLYFVPPVAPDPNLAGQTCDVCKAEFPHAEPLPAVADGRIGGQWAYACAAHAQAHGLTVPGMPTAK